MKSFEEITWLNNWMVCITVHQGDCLPEEYELPKHEIEGVFFFSPPNIYFDWPLTCKEADVIKVTYRAFPESKPKPRWQRIVEKFRASFQ